MTIPTRKADSRRSGYSPGLDSFQAIFPGTVFRFARRCQKSMITRYDTAIPLYQGLARSFGYKAKTLIKIQIVSLSAFLFGGEKGIRTLDTVPRIHDFQSCALDQLSHLSASAAILHYSRAFCKTFFSPAVIRRTSGSWRAFNRHGAPAHDFAGGKTGSARHGA